MKLESLKWLIAHDPCKESDRAPSGAVTIGTRVNLALRIREDALEAIDSVSLVLEEFGKRQCIPLAFLDGAYRCVIVPKDEPHAAFYHFEIACADGETLFYMPRCDSRSTTGELIENTDSMQGFQISVYDPWFASPSWMSGAIMYQVFPDRFARGKDGICQQGVKEHLQMQRPVHLHENWDEPIMWDADQAYDPVDFYGGTLNGIREKLPYIASLGVEILYLNPVFEARSNHRYDTADYEHIDPILGTDEDFEVLCADAAELGIRIICDAVLSHTGNDSRYFNAKETYANPGASQGPESPYFAWYDFSSLEDGLQYRCWWGDPTLPEVDEHNAEWQSYIFGSVLTKWLASGAGGYRLDVADELPDDVLERLRTSVKSSNQQAAIIGEVWEDATTKESYGVARTYALGRSLDSVMNYPLRSALIDFATGAKDAYQLATFLKLQQSNYPAPMYRCLMNLLSSHDVERIRTALALNSPIRDLPRELQFETLNSITAAQDAQAARMQSMLAGLVYALPGMPCIYYGDERGMQGGGDPFCRAPMVWGQPQNRNDYGKDLTDFYRNLGATRRATPELRSSSMTCLALDEDTLCIVRGDDSFIMAIASRAETERVYAIDLRELGIHASDALCPSQSGRLLAIEDGIATVKAPTLETAYIRLG